MKDIIITSQKIRRERNIYLVCFLLAFVINIAAIVAYTRPWIETFTQLGYVFVISLFIYFNGFPVYSLLDCATFFERKNSILTFFEDQLTEKKSDIT